MRYESTTHLALNPPVFKPAIPGMEVSQKKKRGRPPGTDKVTEEKEARRQVVVLKFQVRSEEEYNDTIDAIENLLQEHAPDASLQKLLFYVADVEEAGKREPGKFNEWDIILPGEEGKRQETKKLGRELVTFLSNKGKFKDFTSGTFWNSLMDWLSVATDDERHSIYKLMSSNEDPSVQAKKIMIMLASLNKRYNSHLLGLSSNLTAQQMEIEKRKRGRPPGPPKPPKEKKPVGRPRKYTPLEKREIDVTLPPEAAERLSRGEPITCQVNATGLTESQQEEFEQSLPLVDSSTPIYVVETRQVGRLPGSSKKSLQKLFDNYLDELEKNVPEIDGAVDYPKLSSYYYTQGRSIGLEFLYDFLNDYEEFGDIPGELILNPDHAVEDIIDEIRNGDEFKYFISKIEEDYSDKAEPLTASLFDGFESGFTDGMYWVRNHDPRFKQTYDKFLNEQEEGLSEQQELDKLKERSVKSPSRQDVIRKVIVESGKNLEAFDSFINDNLLSRFNDATRNFYLGSLNDFLKSNESDVAITNALKKWFEAEGLVTVADVFEYFSTKYFLYTENEAQERIKAIKLTFEDPPDLQISNTIVPMLLAHTGPELKDFVNEVLQLSYKQIRKREGDELEDFNVYDDAIEENEKPETKKRLFKDELIDKFIEGPDAKMWLSRMLQIYFTQFNSMDQFEKVFTEDFKVLTPEQVEEVDPKNLSPSAVSNKGLISRLLFLKNDDEFKAFIKEQLLPFLPQEAQNKIKGGAEYFLRQMDIRKLTAAIDSILVEQGILSLKDMLQYFYDHSLLSQKDIDDFTGKYSEILDIPVKAQRIVHMIRNATNKLALFVDSNDLDKLVGVDYDKAALRLGIIAEHDAVNFYNQIASKATNEKVKKIMLDVAKEEKTHAGEFEALLIELDPEQAQELQQGQQEEVSKTSERIWKVSSLLLSVM